MEKKPLSKAIKIFYGVGDLGFSLMTNLGSYLWTFFLTDIAKYDLGTILAMTTASSVIAAITSPIYGGIIDAAPVGKAGKYRSWLLKMTPITLIFSPLAWTKIGGPVFAPIFSITCSIIGSQAFNFGYSANVSLIAVITNSPEEKAQMAATRGMYNNSSKVVWAWIGTPLVALWGRIAGKEELGYPLTSLTFVLCMILGYYAHFKMTEGYEEPGTGEKPAKGEKKKPKDKVSFADMMKALGQNPHLIVVLIVDLCRWLCQFTMMGTAIYFFKYSLNDLALQSTYLVAANICAIVGAYVMKTIVAKVGTRTTGAITFFGLGGCLVIARFVYTAKIPVMTLLIIAQFFLGIAYTSITTLYADCVTYSTWKMGKNAAGFIMGLMNVPIKCSGFIKNFVVTGILASAGYSADIDPANTTKALRDGLANLFILFPGASMLFGAIIYIFGYGLTPKKMEQYKREIAEREAAEAAALQVEAAQ